MVWSWLIRSNFHNYTLAKPFNDRSVKRHMITLKVNDPVVVGEIEWISVQIHGQSFMLHQIVSLSDELIPGANLSEKCCHWLCSLVEPTRPRLSSLKPSVSLRANFPEKS